MDEDTKELMEEVLNTLDDAKTQLKEQTKWIRLRGLQELKTVIQQFSDMDKRIYEFSTEEFSNKDVSEKVGASPATVGRRRKRWYIVIDITLLLSVSRIS